MQNRPDPDRPDQQGASLDKTADEEYTDLDPDTVTEDVIEFFEQGDESPASDADAPAPG